MKIVKPLTVKQIDNAKPSDKPWRLYDGGGLSLLIKPTAKIWHFNYQKPITKKRTIVSLGAYPIVSLADARQKEINIWQCLPKISTRKNRPSKN